MARKDLLKGLMDTNPADPPAPSGKRVDPARPRYASGAIGVVSESIAALKSRAVVEIEPHLIDAGGMHDRLEHDDEDHARLMASLKEYGQQVPILVRPHPDDGDRYQIVYGRRRALALRDLGLPAKAMIRDLDDRALIMAQGQENSSRRDLSFIEKCNFARQMIAADYDRKTVCDALNVDKTLISRMISVTERIPVALIEAIGAAPSVGRDRWLHFADRMATSDYDAEELIDLIPVFAKSQTSDHRFDAALARLEGNPPAASKPRPAKAAKREITKVIKSENGFEIGKVSARDDAVTLTLPRAGNGGFEDWLADNLSRIHRDWIDDPDGE